MSELLSLFISGIGMRVSEGKLASDPSGRIKLFRSHRCEKVNWVEKQGEAKIKIYYRPIPFARRESNPGLHFMRFDELMNDQQWCTMHHIQISIPIFIGVSEGVEGHTSAYSRACLKLNELIAEVRWI
jgi:hypothetical protein